MTYRIYYQKSAIRGFSSHWVLEDSDGRIANTSQSKRELLEYVKEKDLVLTKIGTKV